VTNRELLSVRIMALLILGLASFQLGCGGGGSSAPPPPPPPAVSISVSPSTASVLVGNTQQFTATVENTTNTAVTWQVNGVTGGNSTSGVISTSGLYTAPDPAPNTATVTVSVVSQVDATKSATASVSLSYPAPTLAVASPNSVPAGSGDTTVMLTGTGFTKASTASSNGTPLKTTFLSTQQLSVIVTASSEAAPATLGITVSNPIPGGGASGSIAFQVVGETLTVNITGLPKGTNASVSLAGPAGFAATLTGSQTLVVAPGTYSVTASSISVGSNNFFADVAIQSINIGVGGSATVGVDYSTVVPQATKVLDAAATESMTVSPDGSTVTLPSSSSIAQSLHSGDILVSGSATSAPDGLLRKVLSITSKNSQIVVTTASATLIDAIQQGNFHLSMPIGSQNIQPVPGKEGEFKFLPRLTREQYHHLFGENQVSDSCADVSNVITVPIDEDLLNDGNGKVTASGAVELCPSFTFDWSIGLGGPLGLTPTLHSLDAQANFGEHAHINITGSYHASFDPKDKELTAFQTAPITVLVGPVPVVVRFVVTLFVGANGELNASVSTGVTQDAFVKGGFSFVAGGQLTPDFPTPLISFAPDPVGVDASLDLKGYAGTKIAFELYGVVSPYFKPDAYLELVADINGDPWWTLNGGLEGSGGVDVSVFGLNLFSDEISNLFQFPVPFLHANGAFTPPLLISISPNQASQGSGDVTLSATGLGFVPNASIVFNGNSLATNFVDASSVNATLPASALSNAGNFLVNVTDPDTVAFQSNSATFSVAGNLGNPNPLPTLSTLNPSSVAVGSGTTTVILSGTGFIPGSTVSFNGSNHVSNFVNSSQLTVPLTASDLLAGGLIPVSVFNPAPGGGTSNKLNFLVGVGVTISPASVSLSTGGTQTFQATVTGSTNSAVSWTVQEGASGGTITTNGVYIAPVAAGVFHVIATSQADSGQAGSAAVSVVPGQGAGAFLPTGDMGIQREFFTASLLPNGHVLIAGGIDGSATVLPSAELYDSTTDTFKPTGSMTSPRYTADAVTLPDGKILILGGVTDLISSNVSATADLYDPVSGTFSSAGTMTSPRGQPAATLLANGKVLIAGGVNAFGVSGSVLASAELYDPASGKFTPTGSMTTPSLEPAAVLLASGKVLICGGYDAFGDTQASAELYDPSTGTFTATGNMIVSREDHSATLLPDGKVLVVGGHTASFLSFLILNSAEVYDPDTGGFSAVGNMIAARAQQVATLLGTGQVLVAGGSDQSGNALASAELFEPSSGTFSATGSLTAPRTYTSATLLPNLEVLIPGGQFVNQAALGQPGTVSSSADLYIPPSLPAAKAAPQITGLHKSQLRLVGPSSILVVQGKNFFPGATVTLTGAGAAIQLKTTYLSSILLGVTLPFSLPAAEYMISVTNSFKLQDVQSGPTGKTIRIQ
jgi:hypothetical protein